MTWVEWIGVDPKSGFGILMIIVLAALGFRPIKSFMRKATSKNEADAGDEESRHLDRHRNENVADYWYSFAQKTGADLERAIADREKALKERHDALGEIQAQLSRMQLDCIAEVRAVERKAEERIHEIERKAEERIDELGEKLRGRDEIIARITAKYEECVAENARLNGLLNKRMDDAGFDPSRTKT